MTNRDIVAIGGSAGSIGALREICRVLPTDLPASVLISVHVGAGSPDLLAGILGNDCALPSHTAVDAEPLRAGHIYVAPADHHLLIEDRTIRLGRGPRENMTRPAIDPLFRAVGVDAGPAAIGVLLSGMLNDGASGLADLQRCGGITVVQSPFDAVEAEMPQSALSVSDVDYRAPAGELGDLIKRLVKEDAGPAQLPPASVELEVAIALGRPSDSHTMAKIGKPAPLTCPGCGGPLSQIDRSPLRFRCQVGHGYTAEALASEQEGSVDEAFRIALRVIGERATLLEKMARTELEAGRAISAAGFDKRAGECKRHATILLEAALKA